MAKRRRMSAEMEMDMMKMMKYKHHCMKWGLFILGLLILANSYWRIVRWDFFIGLMLVIAGVSKMLMKKHAF